MTLLRAQWLVPRASELLRRTRHATTRYATTRHARRAFTSAVLVPASPAAARPEHFVDHLPPLAAAAIPAHDAVVFLATPAFAAWLLDDGVFLEKALAALYTNLTPASAPHIHAVCAVVDRLPTRHAHPVNDVGVEGIAYAVLPRAARLSAPPAASGERGCIDFVARTFTSPAGTHHDRLRVPLANTVFQTGAPATLITSSWAPRGGRLERVARQQRQTLALSLSAGEAQSHDAALSIPLLPLTLPRQVDGHMGNIVRGLLDADGRNMTASTELEQVVPRFFTARGEPPQATSAWALVVPQESAPSLMGEIELLLGKSSTSSSKSDSTSTSPSKSDSKPSTSVSTTSLETLWHGPPRWNSLIQHAFLNGARLHKVLSGGGGWGKKAGLLSLDPMPIGAPQVDRANDTTDDFDSVLDFSTALKPVVNDGDYIQFFISPEAPADASPDASPDAQAGSWEFGVIPSTIDALPAEPHASAAPGEMAVHRGVFGALTESGLTLMRGRGLDAATGIADEDLSTTTIDVPFARWSMPRPSKQPAASSASSPL